MNMFVEGQLFSKTWNGRTARLPFLRALVIVFEQLRGEGGEPSASHWTTHHAYLAKHALPRVRAEWSCQTRCDEVLFPWTDDEVSLTWEEWRKTNKQYREDFCRQLGLNNLAQQYANTPPADRSGKNQHLFQHED